MTDLDRDVDAHQMTHWASGGCCDGHPRRTCLNVRHYPTSGPPENPLTADPRLHWADDTPCEYEASE